MCKFLVGVVRYLCDDVPEVVTELVLLLEEELLHPAVRVVIVDERGEYLVENVEHVLLLQGHDELADGAFPGEDLSVQVLEKLSLPGSE